MTLPDEDRLDLPASWTGGEPEHAHQDPDPNAPRRLRELLGEHRKTVEAALELPENAPYVDAVRSYLDGEPDPLGAAAAAALLDSCTGEDVLPHTAVDAWLVEHGLLFATEAQVVGGGLHASSRTSFVSGTWQRQPPGVLRHAFDIACRDVLFQRTAKLRVAIASCEGARYARVRAAADRRRTDRWNRYNAAFLFPREHEWVLQACADNDYEGATNGDLWPLMSTAAQLAALPSPALRPYRVSPGALGTIMGNLGGDSLPALVETAGQPELQRKDRRTVLSGIAMLPTDAAMDYLLDRAEHLDEFTALCEASRRFPARALRLAGARAETAEAGQRRRLEALVEALGTEVREAAMGRLEPDERERVLRLLEPRAAVPSAEADALPRLLVRPPWESGDHHREHRVVKGLKPDRGTALEWKPGERQEWANSGDARRYDDAPESTWVVWTSPDHCRIPDVVRTAAFGPDRWASKALDRVLWSHRGGRVSWDSAADCRRVLARFEADAAAPILEAARRGAHLREVLLPVANLEVARAMAEWYTRVKTARSVALSWFDRHPARAARLLVPDALGKRGKRRDCAEAALILLARRHGADVVEEAARSHGPEALEAMRPVTEIDPLQPVGGVRPSLPVWATSAFLPQVLLKGGERALPKTAVRHLTMALSVCTAEYEYEGVDIIAACCEQRSLAEFSWALFRQWVAFETPADGAWALTQLAYFANEDTVARLVPYLRSWPGESRHHLAVAGLQVLRAIGTERALQAIHQVASRTKFKGLRERAEALVGEIALELGLTADQLADRLVPDFGLGEGAALVVDYGPRQFKVGFDEQLRPFVTDMDGKARKTLPKPGKRDDGEIAEASRKRFSQLKKDLRGVSGDQVRRLEKAMIDGRTWSSEEFHRHFVEHPLVRHLTRRLVWIAAAGDETVSFRVDESSALADASDGPLALPQEAVIRLAHPLLLDTEECEAWTEILSDYEILQPFEQLSRPVMSLTDEERRTGRLTRFEGVETAVGRLLGLTKHGWERSAPQDNGIQAGVSYALPGGSRLNVELDPGIAVGYFEHDEKQVLEAVYFTPFELSWFGDYRNAAPPERLDPVAASELLWTLTRLTEAV